MMIDVRHISKYYRDRAVVDNVSLKITPGERLSLIGPSGCGKSTLLRIIQGLIKPDAGDVYFRGEPISSFSRHRMREYRRRVGIVFQHFNLIAHLNVAENVALALRAAGIAEPAVSRRVHEALDLVGLVQLADAYPTTLSGGERQRLAIARVLALRPEVILWDEPTSALDPILVGEVLEVISDLARSRQTTMVIVTHELRFAIETTDRMVLMEKGRIVEEGPPQTVLFQPSTACGRRFAQAYRRRYGSVLPKLDECVGRNGAYDSRRDQVQSQQQTMLLHSKPRKVISR